MKNTLTINHTNHTIVMDKAFARNAINTRSEEYAHLQNVRRDYPNYQVVQRHIRKNSAKKTYKGLTYEYMEDYILTHSDEKTRIANFNEYNEMRIIAECHGKAFRYPVIKSWFLEKYPEITNFGLCETEQIMKQSKANTQVAGSDVETDFSVSNTVKAPHGPDTDHSVGTKTDNKAKGADERGNIITSFVDEDSEDDNARRGTISVAA